MRVATMVFKQSDEKSVEYLGRLLNAGYKINNYAGYPIKESNGNNGYIVNSYHSFVLIKDEED